jgi:hypothetical protein
MQTLLTKYIRDEKNNPRGVAVAVRHNDEVLYGYSLCSPSDVYDKQEGLEKALYRAFSTKGYHLPKVPDRFEKVVNAYESLQERAVKYFKDLDYKNIVLSEVEDDGLIKF